MPGAEDFLASVEQEACFHSNQRGNGKMAVFKVQLREGAALTWSSIAK